MYLEDAASQRSKRVEDSLPFLTYAVRWRSVKGPRGTVLLPSHVKGRDARKPRLRAVPQADSASPGDARTTSGISTPFWPLSDTSIIFHMKHGLGAFCRALVHETLKCYQR